MPRILIVEDEKNLLDPLAELLRKEGFEIVTATTIHDAEARLAAAPAPDLVLLDWMLPDGHGIELLKSLRARGQQMPVLLLTARAELIDKVLGLELGANDYVTKPYEPRELIARIRVRLRESSARNTIAAAPATVEAGGITITLASREASYGGETLELTKTEFELLRLFVENPDQVYSREELLKRVWGYDRSPTTRTVDTHILQLRQKTDPELFETVHGIGYRFRSRK